MAETTETTEIEQPFLEEDGVFYVGLRLAHPLDKQFAERCQAKVKRDYAVGQVVYVPREWGNALIDAGRVQVDPEDKVGRREALWLNRRNQPLAREEVAARQAAAREAAAPAQEAPVQEPQQPAQAGGDAGAAVAAPVEAPQSAATAPSSEAPAQALVKRPARG